ncbi:hypothetical protein AAG570_007345 [Ranatra chinensis]|uniref:C2H2-type domain-containing protein n=1 Tax=Ranatra chinensis TaxID=642074 RepID=A0ABD0XVK8_9HEMI
MGRSVGGSPYHAYRVAMATGEGINRQAGAVFSDNDVRSVIPKGRMDMRVETIQEGVDTDSDHSRPLTDSVASWCSAEVCEEEDMTAVGDPQKASYSRKSETEESNSDRQESEGEEQRQGRGKRRCPRPQRRLECGVCSASGFESEHELTRHIRSHHHQPQHLQQGDGGAEAAISGEAATTQCKLCGKVLGSVSSLDRHLLVHSGERPFSCRICGTKFTTNGNMHRSACIRVESPTPTTPVTIPSDPDDLFCRHMRSHDLTSFGGEQQPEHQPHKKRKVHEFNNNNIGDLGADDPGALCRMRCQRFAPRPGSISREHPHPAFAWTLSQGSSTIKVVPLSTYFCPYEELDSPSEPKRRTSSGVVKKTADGYSCPACHRRDFLSRQLLDAHVDRDHPSCRCQDCDSVFRSPKLLSNHRAAYHQPHQGASPRKTPSLRVIDEDHLRLIEFSTGKFPMIAEAMAARRPPPSRRYTVLAKDEEAASRHNHLRLDDHKNDFLASLDLKKLNMRCFDPKFDLLGKSNPQSPCWDQTGGLESNTCCREDELESSGGESTSSSNSAVSSGESPPPMCADPAVLLPPAAVSVSSLDMTPPDSGSRGGPNHDQLEEEQDCMSAEIRRMKLRGEFPCRLCPSVFPNLRALKGHNRVHLLTGHSAHLPGALDFQCNMCHFSGPDRGAVLRHMRTHNGDRPYECALCNYAFTTKANCERHLRNRHAASRCDLKKSIIYHPSEDPINDPSVASDSSGTGNNHQREDVKRTLFPEETDDTEEEEEEHEEKVEGPLDLSMDALDLSKKKRVEEEDVPQDLSKKKAREDMGGAAALGLRAFYGAMPPFIPNFLPPYFVGTPHPQLLFRPLAEMKERLEKELLRQLGATSLLMPPAPEEPPAPPRPPTPPEKLKKPPPPSAASSVKMVIKNGVLVPKQKQRRYRTERPFGCEHCSAKFTLRSNMERHVKQQHPQFWSRRGPRGSAANRRPQQQTHNNKQIVNNNNHLDSPVRSEEMTSKEKISQGVKMAIVEQLKAKIKLEGGDEGAARPPLPIQDYIKKEATRVTIGGPEPDLASVSKLLDNASTQTFRQYFEAANQEEATPTQVQPATPTPIQHQQFPPTNQSHDIASVTSDDEEGLVASHSEESEENKSENESTASNGSCGGQGSGGGSSGKKKSAYSLAPNRVSCPYCLRKFPWSSSLRRHVLTHTGQKPYKCPHCPLLFTTKSNCDRHLTRKHGSSVPGETPPPAAVQPPPTDQARNVPERPYKCSRCPSSTFSTLGNLKKHVGSKHEEFEESSPPQQQPPPLSCPQVSEMPFKCHLCEGAFAERQDALDHMRELHEAEYSALVSKGALESSCEEVDDSEDHHHQHHHHQETPRAGRFPDYANRKVMCAFCLRRFWSAEDLRRHMRTHTGERPFSCDVCTRKFTLKHSMLRHRKKHSAAAAGTSLQSLQQRAEEDETQDGVKEEPEDDDADKSSMGRHPADSDLIGDLLGIGDKSLVDSILDKSADDAARLLGVRVGEALVYIPKAPGGPAVSEVVPTPGGRLRAKNRTIVESSLLEPNNEAIQNDIPKDLIISGIVKTERLRG